MPHGFVRHRRFKLHHVAWEPFRGRNLYLTDSCEFEFEFGRSPELGRRGGGGGGGRADVVGAARARAGVRGARALESEQTHFGTERYLWVPAAAAE